MSFRYCGFDGPAEYFTGLVKTPQRLVKRVFLRKGMEDQEVDKEVNTGAEMKRVLGAFELVCLGIGLMLGAGVFVTTGEVAVDYAGPAIIISFAVAGLSALLSSLCYAEFAVALPLSGGAYSYVSAVFGEYLAWITVTNLIFEYVLANAAVIRGFAPYFGSLINKGSDFFLYEWKGYEIDWWAFGWCLMLTVLLVLGTKESAWFNNIVTVLHVLVVVLIIIAGLVKSNPANAKPFFNAEHGTKGIFNGAAIVFFSYIGFDAVATSAEEVRNPARDMPIGILGALGVVTTCYMLMAASLVMMVPIGEIDTKAPFSEAFGSHGMPWAKYIVAIGALMGIVTGTLVGMFAVSRIIAAVARTHLLPPFLAKVHKRFGTPFVATAIQGVATAVIALFTDFADLINMVSISTLFAFWIVGLALIWFRGYQKGVTSTPDALKLAAHMFLMVSVALVFTICYWLVDSYIPLVVCGAVYVVLTGSMHFFCRGQFKQMGAYGVPLFPWVPAASVFLNTFLLGQLDQLAYERFGIWTAAITAIYILYGIHSATLLDDRKSSLPRLTHDGETSAKVVEGEATT